jgi:hypothetical protein
MIFKDRKVVKQLLAHVSGLFGLLVLVCGLLSASSCGGGTTGTGGTGSSEFSGRITSLEDFPLVGASVVLTETGDSTVTDNDGSFVMESDFDGPNATLLIETTSVQASTTITDLPPGPHDVNVELKVDEQRNSVTLKSKRISPPKTRRPIRTPTPIPVATQPSPVESPAPLPTPLETTIPNETVAPTAIPEPTVVPIGTTSPTPIVDVTPTPVEVHPATLFRGTISGPALLLSKIRIGIVGFTARAQLKTGGAFAFRRLLTADTPQLELIAGKQSVRIPLEGVISSSVRVNLQITVSKSGGVFKAVLDSATIVD